MSARRDGRRPQAPSDVAAPAGTSTPANAKPAAPAAAPPTPARRLVQITLAVLGGLFVYHMIADRVTPYTAQSALNAPLTQVAAQVSGQVVSVEAFDNAPVTKGQVLFRIDRLPLQIALRNAEANLAVAVQAADVSELDVRYAEADLGKMQIDRSTTDELGRIVIGLAERKAVSETTAIRARSSMEISRADVQRAEVELQRARVRLGESGADNAKVRQALALLEQARLDLRNATVVAPADGVVTNLRLASGQYANRGSPVLTFIEDGRRWITAEMRENQLGNIDPGDEVGIVFDDQPGRVFSGRVDSIGWGISQGGEAPTGTLPDVPPPGGWLREPQRFPVRIVVDPVDKDDPQPPSRSGAQANIVVYTKERSIFNPIARLWLRAIAIVSYAR